VAFFKQYTIFLSIIFRDKGHAGLAKFSYLERLKPNHLKIFAKKVFNVSIWQLKKIISLSRLIPNLEKKSKKVLIFPA